MRWSLLIDKNMQGEPKMNSEHALVIEAAIEARIYILKILYSLGYYDKKDSDWNFEVIDYPIHCGIGGYAIYKSNNFNETLSEKEKKYAIDYATESIIPCGNYLIKNCNDEFFEVVGRDKICIISPLELIKGDELIFIQNKIGDEGFFNLLFSQQQLWGVFENGDSSYSTHKILTRSLGRLRESLESLVKNNDKSVILDNVDYIMPQQVCNEEPKVGAKVSSSNSLFGIRKRIYIFTLLSCLILMFSFLFINYLLSSSSSDEPNYEYETVNVTLENYMDYLTFSKSVSARHPSWDSFDWEYDYTIAVSSIDSNTLVSGILSIEIEVKIILRGEDLSGHLVDGGFWGYKTHNHTFRLTEGKVFKSISDYDFYGRESYYLFSKGITITVLSINGSLSVPIYS